MATPREDAWTRYALDESMYVHMYVSGDLHHVVLLSAVVTIGYALCDCLHVKNVMHLDQNLYS